MRLSFPSKRWGVKRRLVQLVYFSYTLNIKEITMAIVKNINRKNQSISTKDVSIIGAGWSGILAAKYMLAEGFSVQLLEKRNGFGGVWNFSEDISCATALQNTETTSSKVVTEMSDFIMPENYPWFPTQPQVLKYLEDYAKNFHVLDKIIYKTEVKHIKKKDGFWIVIDQNGCCYRSKFIVITTGLHQSPNDIRNNPIFSNYSGQIIHVGEFKKASNKFFKKKILIYGGGESASDLAYQLSSITKKLFWTIPNGQWFTKRQIDPPVNMPIDFTTYRLSEYTGPYTAKNKYLSYLLHDTPLNGGGMQHFKTCIPHARTFFNKSSEVLKLIGKSIETKPNIKSIKKNKVKFFDDTEEEIDIILLCTGYKRYLPKIENIEFSSIYDLYQFILPKKDFSIGFVGFVRPVFGSIPGISEMQALYLSKVFAKKIKINKNKINKEIKNTKNYIKNLFQFRSRPIEGLVEHTWYVDRIAKAANVYPDYWKLFFKNPRKWWTAIIAPYHNCQFLINDKNKHDYVFEVYEKYKHKEEWKKHLGLKRGRWILDALIYLILNPIFHLIDYFKSLFSQKNNLL